VKGYLKLLEEIFGKENIQHDIEINELGADFNRIFMASIIPERIARALKLYYQIEPSSKGALCKSYKDVGNEIENLNFNKHPRYGRTLTRERTRQMVDRGRRLLRRPSRCKLLEKYLITTQ